ncbi:MAG: hypothetical protein K0R64_334 [Novosphingobium lindaniclasticum]|jgi:uncharacterized protein (DUF1697 family)|uniref:DUF1697 domain-containing protein n=1 Tax=Novosphingobium lindaniclasticum LE124 TaxID=1096930 RepID=T0I5F1_9SPHN|nr:DUF1697 domain-containing protein [Novosphingobium lindaniclasticum]EQB19588.1 hypothetical protein L284_01375 [Novosphingobium lindaniclasticum LE124]MDF2637350.1 hypothetical protein [Novosphingobium lindaniclasticum]
MTRYCAFFASLIVGGDRLSMADLRYAFEREELENAETVISSGNVLFDYEERPSEGLEELLAYLLRDRFDLTAFVAVRKREEIRAAVEENPFVGSDDAFVHSVLLERQPTRQQFGRLVGDHGSIGAERLALGDRCLFVDFGGPMGESLLTMEFIEKRLACRGAARNVRSLARIVAKM